MARDLPAVLPRGKPAHTGRDARGRFVSGAAPGPGRPANPFARYQAELRQALLAEVSPADLRAVLRQVLRLAKRGHLPAVELLLRWTLGGPPPTLDPDQLDRHEREVRAGRLTMLDHLAQAEDPGEAESNTSTSNAFPDEAEEPPAEPEDPDPLAPSLRQTLSWCVEELAQAQYALRRQPPPPDPAQSWARFAEQRVEFDEAAAVEVEALYLAYARWCAGHGEPVLAEDQVLAWLTAHGATLDTRPLTQVVMVVGVRVVA
jgi:hypothetical protein